MHQKLKYIWVHLWQSVFLVLTFWKKERVLAVISRQTGLEKPARVSKKWSWWRIATVVITLAPFAFYTVSLLRMMLATLLHPWELDQGEGHNVWSAWLLLQGRGPYLDLNHYPFYNSNYPPFHFVMMLPILALTGPSLFAGRLLADLCLFGLALAVFAIVWRYSRRNIWASVLAGLFVLANPYIYIFGTLATVNVSQVMLGAWGLYFLGVALDRLDENGAVLKREKVNYVALVAGLFFLLAAVYTKQQAVDAVAAGFLFLLWRRPVLAIISGVAYGAVGGLLFLLINAITDNQFYINLILVNVNDFSRRQLLDQVRAYAMLNAPLIILGAGYALTVVLSKGRVTLWLLYVVTTTGAAALVGKLGAGETYFYSSIAAVAIVAGLMWDWLDRRFFRSKSGKAYAVAGVALLLLTFQAVIFYHTPETPHPWKNFIKGHSGNYVLFGGLPDEAERARGQRISDMLGSVPQPVMTDEAGFVMPHGYEVVTNPSNIMVFNDAKYWKSAELESMVKVRCFSRIMMHGQFIPEVVKQHMYANYTRIETITLNRDPYYIWERNAPPDPATPACQIPQRYVENGYKQLRATSHEAEIK
jgi:uncharacterized integral membrane protein